jgi:hypothetical protein
MEAATQDCNLEDAMMRGDLIEIGAQVSRLAFYKLLSAGLGCVCTHYISPRDSIFSSVEAFVQVRVYEIVRKFKQSQKPVTRYKIRVKASAHDC